MQHPKGCRFGGHPGQRGGPAEKTEITNLAEVSSPGGSMPSTGLRDFLRIALEGRGGVPLGKNQTKPKKQEGLEGREPSRSGKTKKTIKTNLAEVSSHGGGMPSPGLRDIGLPKFLQIFCFFRKRRLGRMC